MTSVSPLSDASRVRRLYWTLQIGSWSVYGFTRAYAGIMYLDLPWQRALVETLVLHATALGLTHLLRGYMKRHDWGSLSRRRLAFRAVTASFILGLPLGIATQFTSLSALQNPESLGVEIGSGVIVPLLILLHIVNWAAAFMAWLILYYVAMAMRQYKSAELRQSELARALQLAELRVLKSQLNPHFLFNALNTVRSLIVEDPAKAQGAVTRLANTLRYTLASGQEELVTLEQELEIVDDYLGIETLRFEDRLRISRNIAPQARGARIPVMLLQTVVENAIKHGIAALPAGGELKIDAQLDTEALVLRVENPRPAVISREPREGVGLRNAAERLRLLFGPSASLSIDLSQPELAIVQISIPTAHESPDHRR